MGLLDLIWASHYTTEIVFPPKPALIATKEQDPNTGHISLQEFVETRCSSLLHSEFRPPWWLWSSHLQTLYCFFDRVPEYQLVYNRTLLRLKDGGTLGLDFTIVDDDDLRPDTPVVVVMPGMTGGSHAGYLRAILAPACLPVPKGGLGYRGVVVNFRGCAGVQITSPQLYNGGHTDDFRQAMFYISKQFPDAPLLGLSFSLGANLMTRYVAEEGEQCLLKSVCALACPWDLEANIVHLRSTFIGRNIYSRGMGRNLVDILKGQLPALSADPNHEVAKAARRAIALRWPSVIMFDSTFTNVGGGPSPPWPFESATEYYRYASSHKVLGSVRVPFLAISSADDAVVRENPKDGGGSQWVVLATTSHGGHCSWLESDGGWFTVRRWVARPALEWLHATAEDFVRDRPRHHLLEADGFLTEAGKENLGCKVVGREVVVISPQGEPVVVKSDGVMDT
ncbi:AB-hydrolase YheT [Phlebopus sp. FC_14]|nr:AB-hydrolase YheT [Phlebopus sp. FC_14]